MTDEQWRELDETTRLFLDSLRRSGLLDDTVLDEVLVSAGLHQQRSACVLPLLTSTLIERGLLTPWQIEKLLQRKFKGFILGDFVVMDYLESLGDFTRYKAFDRKRKREVILRVPPASKRTTSEVQFEVEENN